MTNDLDTGAHTALAIMKLLLIALLCAATPAQAHHSFVAEFTEETETINGVIKEVIFRNPHVRIYIDVEEKGAVVTWEVQSQSTLTLDRYGISAEVFAPGTKVKVLGFKGRNDARKLFLRELTLPSGEVLRPNPSQQAKKEYEEIF
tara:strand:+ start:8436 stop:8873 length:438 start_codon:yes stop_codon:yes gene_type:complete